MLGFSVNKTCQSQISQNCSFVLLNAGTPLTFNCTEISPPSQAIFARLGFSRYIS